MYLNEAVNNVRNERDAGYEKVKLEYVTKSKIPSFEIKKLEEEYGVISSEQQLYAVEISYKKKYNNITKTYFIDSSIARDYFNKTANDMRNQVLGRAYISDKPSELKRISKVKDFHTKVAVACNPNTSADTLLFLWKGDFLVKNIVLNNPNTGIELLKSVIEKSENIANVMVASENLRRRKMAVDFSDISIIG
jgi:hypothetical protein